MTLPNQPASPLDVLGNEEFFRIYQPVTSPGDVYEIDSSARAIYLGPFSDVSEVGLTYFSQQAARSMATAGVSAGGPFVNRIDSLLDTQYPGIGQQARILASPIDIVDQAYIRPTDSMAVPLRRYNLPTYIDLICALKTVPSIPTDRPDRTFRLKVPVNNDASGGGDDGSTDLVIPIYGRRMATIYTVTPAGTQSYFEQVFLVALQPGVSAPAKALCDPILHASSMDPTVESLVFRASDQINRDATFGSGSTSVPTTFSYTENNGLPLPRCKGMGDLLVINFLPNPIGPSPGYAVLDVFIKLSDKEEG